MAETLPRAQDQYDKSTEQNTRRIIEQRLGDLERAIYDLRTSYGTVSLGETTISTLVPASTSTNDDVAPGYSTFLRLTTTSGAFTITGFSGGEKGRLLIILNVTGQNMTLAHETTSVAANRISTMTGANVTSTGNGAAILVYDAQSSLWRVIVTPFEATT